ncbi:MAG: Ig-like domain-containing protein [Thermoproteota archaeon]|nr:Ig-like domain-containing protein [Thermoproteota archaeon]
MTINIAAVNDAPIAEDDTATTDQDTPVVIDVLANDMDADIEQGDNGEGSNDDSIILDSVPERSVQGGSVARIVSNDSDNDDEGAGRSLVNEKIEYTPAKGFFGTDPFTYTIVDTNGAIAFATVTVTVSQIVAESEEEELLSPTNALDRGDQ